ncbi:hypothetical protein [Spirulina subsalsa]|uniref:hypothetical protein n=1 Tax=Spirulina subsalsa TaxID=54311 RepID=UPI000475026C|nr:hypothetical protein [Spirulina subsalsa]
MSWIFSLSAECGSDESNVHQFAGYFEGISYLLSNGHQCKCCTDIFQDIEENWWCRISFNHLSEVGIDSPESAYLMTELGILLYQSLQLATTFRYALVGVEVDEFRTYSELMEELSSLSIPGLVLAKSFEQELGSLSGFRAFSANYIWQPYAGEVYNPLMMSPTLKNKLDELLAVG